MSVKYKFNDPEAFYIITFAVIGWIDVFTRKVYKDLLLDSFRFCIKEKGLVIHAYVIMSNHVHLIISKTGNPSLSDIMRDLEKVFISSYFCKKLINIHKKAGENGCYHYF